MRINPRRRSSPFRLGCRHDSVVGGRGLVDRADAGENKSTARAAREQFFEKTSVRSWPRTVTRATATRSRRAGCGSTRWKRCSREETPARPSCPGSRPRALPSMRSTMMPRCPRRASSRPEKVAVLTHWVSLGAPWPGGDRAAAHPGRQTRRRYDPPAPMARPLWSLDLASCGRPRDQASISQEWFGGPGPRSTDSSCKLC